MKTKTENKMGATAQYKGFTLTLARGAKAPVILIINKDLTSREDGVIEVVANPTVAKKSVDRRARGLKQAASMEDSERMLKTGDVSGLAAAMMRG
jgi:hypothetical protein